MMNLYDHRFATYDGATGAAIPAVTDEQHDDPTYEPLPRYWVAEHEVTKGLGDDGASELLFGWRKITRNTDTRTFIATMLPISAAGDSLMFAHSIDERLLSLQGVWSSLQLDYVLRQKLSGTNFQFFIMKQLACPPPSAFDETPAWLDGPLATWLRPRVLELTLTSHALASIASETGNVGMPFRWVPDRRHLIRAEIDAAMFHLFGLDRDEVEHVLSTFTVMNKYDLAEHGDLRTAKTVLAFYDRMADAAATGVPYRTLIDPVPGQGSRHKEGVTT